MGMRDNGCGCGCGNNDMRRGANGRQCDARSKVGDCGCGARDDRRSGAPWLRDSRGGGGCERNGQRDRMPREGGCACGGRQVRNDERRDCPCSGYDAPRMEYGEECCALLHRLQELDFSIQEVVLYLDAYPDCCEAKSYYRKLVCEREMLAKEYEGQCGPLTAMGNGDATEWMWCKSPWPWQIDFPGNRRV